MSDFTSFRECPDCEYEITRLKQHLRKSTLADLQQQLDSWTYVADAMEEEKKRLLKCSLRLRQILQKTKEIKDQQ